MDHSYQLTRPSIETIIDYCNDLLADEKLTVFEFGENCDLVLHIYKDEEFNPAMDKSYYKKDIISILIAICPYIYWWSASYQKLYSVFHSSFCNVFLVDICPIYWQYHLRDL